MRPRQVFPFWTFGFVLSVSFFPASLMENDPAVVLCSAFTRWNLSSYLQCCLAECWDPGGLTLHPLHPISKKCSKGSPRSLETWTVVNNPARHLFSLSTKVLMDGIFKIAAQSGENRWTNRNPYFCRFGLPSFGKRGTGCSMKCYSKQCCDSSSIKYLSH